jgi:hypothetical protein
MEVTFPPLQQTAEGMLSRMIAEQTRRINRAMDTAAKADVINWLVGQGYGVTAPGSYRHGDPRRRLTRILWGQERAFAEEEKVTVPKRALADLLRPGGPMTDSDVRYLRQRVGTLLGQRDHARQKLGTVEARLHEARQKLAAIAERVGDPSHLDELPDDVAAILGEEVTA